MPPIFAILAWEPYSTIAILTSKHGSLSAVAKEIIAFFTCVAILLVEPDSSKTTITQKSHSVGNAGLLSGVQFPVVCAKALFKPNNNKKDQNSNSCFLNRLFENK